MSKLSDERRSGLRERIVPEIKRLRRLIECRTAPLWASSAIAMWKRDLDFYQDLLALLDAPPAPTIYQLRPEVKAFAALMEGELRKHDHRLGWKECDPEWLMVRLKEEAAELAQAILTHEESIPAEAADVANFAMMIADVEGGLRTVAPPAPTSEVRYDEEGYSNEDSGVAHPKPAPTSEERKEMLEFFPEIAYFAVTPREKALCEKISALILSAPSKVEPIRDIDEAELLTDLLGNEGIHEGFKILEAWLHEHHIAVEPEEGKK